MPALVTVVVPCYNYGQYLRECIGSLLSQSYREWECIIVDDGSSDATPEVGARLAREDQRVTFFRQANGGLSAARNAGITRARGEFLQFLDADDVLEPYKLQAQVKWLERHSEIDIVVGGAAFFGEDAGADLQAWRPESPFDATPGPGLQGRILPALVAGNICVVNAALVRRRVFDAVGLFDETLPAHEDWEFWLRCALGGRQLAMHSAGGDRALVRQHTANMSSSRERMAKTAMTVRRRLEAQLPAELRADNAERLSEMKWRFGLDLIRAGRMAEGWALYQEGLRSSRNKTRTLSRLISLVPGVSDLARLGRRLRE